VNVLATPLSRVIALLTVTFFAACGDSTTGPPPDPPRATTVTVSPATADLAALGATVQLTAEVLDQNGQAMAGAAVTWASSAAAMASVSASGLVTAVANGNATITATSGSASGSARVTVAQKVSAVAVAPDTATVVEGDTVRLAATATDANGNVVPGADIVWASGDTAVAVVDAFGLVTAVGAGQAEVSATTAGITGRAQLTVVPPAPTAIAVTPDMVELTALGQTTQFNAEVRDQIGRVMENQPVVWASDDTKVATVDSAGLVTAAANGTAAISATAGSSSDTAVVSVRQTVRSATVSPAADTVVLGDTLRLVAEAYDENGHAVQGATFTWSSSNVAVATVDPAGLVGGIAEGTATMTANAGDASGTSDITVVNPDRAALIALYEATDGQNWRGNTNWLTDKPLGEWYGVDTDADDRVVRLNLAGTRDDGFGLTGPIPPELGDLSNLGTLSLEYNSLTGAIPPELGNLSNLDTLALYSNSLTGTIPRELGNLSNLRRLSLSGNSLTGTIPRELGDLSNLRRLSLGGNSLTGAIPPELGDLSNLRFLGLNLNSLVGAIPAELGDLSNLERLSLIRNSLVGAIPAELGDLSNLKDLWLENNSLVGAIPAELGDLSNLETLYLGDNSLSGAIPAELGDLSNLEILWLDNNSLAGAIPAELGDLSNLKDLRLHANSLSGAIPLDFVNLSLTIFYWYGNPGLCSPATRSFQDWLRSIRIHSGGKACGDGDFKTLRGLRVLSDGRLRLFNIVFQCLGGPNIGRIIINGVRWEFHESWWQRNTGSAWQDVAGTRKTGELCGYDLTSAPSGRYRVVADITIGGVRDKYKSENEITK